MSRRVDADVHGICIVDKEAGWTSHDVVAKARGLLGTRKVGHSGTLDPPATGVLVLGVGRATRLLRWVTGLPKTYTGEIVLGTETSTLDDTGEVVARHEMGGVEPAAVEAAARALRGDILQVPPMVSAVKVDGQRLHELARRGEAVERQARPVTIHALDVAPTGDPLVFTVRVECSSGTYVRTIADDLGRALGGGAHLRRLRRLAVGPFTIDEARPLEQLEVLPPREAFRDRPALTVGGDLRIAVGHGKVLDRDDLGAEGDGPWPVVGPDGELLAVYEAHRGSSVKPAVVVGPVA